MPRGLCRLRLLLAALGTAPLALAACKASPRATGVPDWDRVAFALQLVRQEYGEQVEDGNFAALPALATALGDARAALGSPSAETKSEATSLAELRARVLRHEPPQVVAKKARQLLLELGRAGRLHRRPPAAPDLARGAATYALGCAPCHGPPNGPPPPSVAQMIPRPPNPTDAMSTPYELFNRITYGGAGTPMPAFADTLPESVRWEIAFYLFADRWPPCTDGHLPPLTAASLAYLSDFDLWQTYGYGPAACLRRRFRPPGPDAGH